SSAASALRGSDPANGFAVTVVPVRRTSNSGLAPTNVRSVVVLSSPGPVGRSTANTYAVGSLCARLRTSRGTSTGSDSRTRNVRAEADLCEVTGAEPVEVVAHTGVVPLAIAPRLDMRCPHRTGPDRAAPGACQRL